jgi:uncharacterized OsmC-like protein
MDGVLKTRVKGNACSSNEIVELRSHNPMSKHAFSVEYGGQLRTQMTHLASGTVVETDAPVDNHGRGEVFSPTDLVASAVASCMMTIVGIRCADWGVPAPAMRTTVSKEMLDKPRRIGRVVVEMVIQIDPDHDRDSLRTRIRRVAETCPVAESLHPDCQVELRINWGSE